TRLPAQYSSIVALLFEIGSSTRRTRCSGFGKSTFAPNARGAANIANAAVKPRPHPRPGQYLNCTETSELWSKDGCVCLRTRGDDFDLAAGFLFTESILHRREEIESIRHWGSPNVVRVALRDGARIDLLRLQRHFYSTSSCGVCGKASIDALRVSTTPLDG